MGLPTEARSGARERGACQPKLAQVPASGGLANRSSLRRTRARSLPTEARSGAGERRLAGSTGLEPAASAVTGRRSSQLNYDPNGAITRIGKLVNW
jgi:hypothetical protein